MPTYTGTSGNNSLYGSTGDDILIGLQVNDSLYGNSRNDSYVFSTGDGDDYIYDSGGVDEVKFNNGVGRGSIRFFLDGDELEIYNDSTGDKITLDEQLDGGPVRVEKIAFADGSSIDLLGPLTYTGTDGAERVDGTNGTDTLVGKAGDDSLYGYDGNDTYVFEAYDGADGISDRSGDDTLSFTGAVRFDDLSFYTDPQVSSLRISNPSTGDRIYLASQLTSSYKIEHLTFADGSSYTWNGTEFVGDGPGPGPTPTAGDDTLTLTTGADTIDLLAGNDKVYGLAGNDLLTGNTGNDTLYGDEGNDSLYGSPGTDLVDGGAGNDIVKGGQDKDTLRGGPGADTFLIESVADSRVGATRDIVRDFTRGDDRINVSSFAGEFDFIGSSAFSGAGEIRAVRQTSSGTTLVQGSTDSDRQPEFEIELARLVTLQEGDFVL